MDGIETEHGTLTLIHNTIYTGAAGTNVTLYYVSSTIQLMANLIQTPQTTICKGVGDLPVSLGYNISNANGLCGTLVTGDQMNTSPQLGTLENYGGLTQTINLSGSSPALDAIPTGQCTLNVDQRGISRPQFDACDSGAFEADRFTLFVPELVGPADNAQITAQPAALSWNSVLGTDHYEIQMGRMNPPTNPIVTSATTSYAITDALLQTSYFWRVRAVDEDGNITPWSAIRGFTILSTPNAAPSINLVVSPTPTLTWSSINWAVGYEIVIGSNATFPLPYVDQEVVDASTLSYTTPNLPGGSYFWRVRAKKSDGTWGGWSAPQPFTIASP